MLALENITVLDLTHVAPGRFCTMILGDMGAEVIRIEASPDLGMRGSGRGTSLRGEQQRRRAVFQTLNRNKKSMGLNLKAEKSREIFHKLAEKADVIVEGFRPGVVKRLGIDYETIKGINSRIVYCSLSGYGHDGPYSTLPGHDINYISFAGVLGLIGSAGHAPVVPLNLIGDFAGASLHGVIGILAALIAREKTGEGQYVDIAYADGALALLTMFTQDYFSDGIALRRGETILQGAYPYYGVYETKDGKYLSIGCIEKWFWDNLCRALGKEEYMPYHLKPEHFNRKSDEEIWNKITADLKQVFSSRTRDEWFELLANHDVPVGKVYDLEEVFSDPQVKHRQMVIEIDHPLIGKVKQVGMPIKLSETPCKIRNLAPLFGEHTVEILNALGYNSTLISRLKQERVIDYD